MNKTRRKRLQDALDLLTEVKDEEQLAYDNLPDSFRDADQGTKMEEGISNIDDAIGSIEEVINA